MEEPLSVLVVEDHEHVRDVLEYNLRLDGFVVHTAADGPSAIQQAHRARPDVILLDWMMPKMDGMRILSDIKSSHETADIPVFMLTAKAFTADIEHAMQAGADDYITKPFDPMLLGRTIVKKLKRCTTHKCAG